MIIKLSANRTMAKHLIVLQNGLNGFSFQMSPIKAYLETQLGDGYIVVISDVNTFHRTWEGIDLCGQRLADFTIQTLLSYDGQIDRLSFVGHSLGGLIIRNGIERLEAMGLYEEIKPMLMVSIASPHLGIKAVKSHIKVLARYCIGLTGQELLLEDEPRLLEQMAKPDYTKGLARFQCRILYANLKGDSRVSPETALMCSSLKPIENLPLDHLRMIDPKTDCQEPKEEAELITNLEPLGWVRKVIDLSDCFNVHNTIANKGYSEQLTVLADLVSHFQQVDQA